MLNHCCFQHQVDTLLLAFRSQQCHSLCDDFLYALQMLLFQALAAIAAKLQVALEDSKGPTPIEALSKLSLERLQVEHQRSLQLLKKLITHRKAANYVHFRHCHGLIRLSL